MKKVTEYPIKLGEPFTCTLKRGSQVLSVQERKNRGDIALWALENEDVSTVERRTFRVYPTDHLIVEPEAKYICTFQQQGGYLIWHLFETTPRNTSV